LDQEKLDQFFKAVASGFATTPKEVLLRSIAESARDRIIGSLYRITDL